MVAEIIINSNVRALNKKFDYIVPNDMEKSIFVGARVFVPFGNGKKLEDGFVISLKDSSEFANKEIAKLSFETSLSEEKVTLAGLMSQKYFCNISDCIKLMLPPGTKDKDEEKREKEKQVKFVYIKCSAEQIDGLKSEKQKRALNFLKENNEIYLQDFENLADVSYAVIKTLEKNGLLELKDKTIERNPFVNKKIEKDEKKVLNSEQQECFDSIAFCIEHNEFSQNLIFGITGSGKTEIYMQLIEKVLEQGKTAIMLVPEISLTPQIVDRFLARFGENVAVLHSKLSSGERYDEWQKIQNGKCKIIIGARSAIFAPVNNLGIIIIDEEHDQSYKSESTPKYNAKDLAKYLAEKNRCPLVLGSATPDLCSMYNAKNNNIALHTLTKRAGNAFLPSVKIVDLRQELAMGNRSMISLELKEEIRKNIENKKQTILFLNRRGYSTFIMCRDCGYVAKCKNCNISLTYHSKENRLKCHYCGYETKIITECPECKSKNIKYFGTGTQKLEDEIHKIFPEASVLRMDLDTVKKKNSHEEILNKFKNENINILIGTQMVAKGHHFPNVTLVGVMAADSTLNMDDYRAVEKTFQTIIQVSGRSGREEKGKVIIQTYNPDHYAIIDAQKQNYNLFYEEELKLRKILNYPPFCDIILINFQSVNENEVKNAARFFNLKLKSYNIKNSMLIYNEMPAPIDKINGKYRWRIIAKCKANMQILNILNAILYDENYKKFKNTSTFIDINPNNMS